MPQSGGRGLSPSFINRSISAHALDERLDRASVRHDVADDEVALCDLHPDFVTPRSRDAKDLWGRVAGPAALPGIE